MHRQSGFSLVELAIVILIMGLILGGLAMPLSVQRDNARYREAQELLTVVENSIQGFALVNGHLPCPATPASGGFALASAGGCAVPHGFVPASTLGLAGPRNDDNLLLDPWSVPVRYSVSAVDIDGDGNWDFTAPGELKDVGLANLAPDLVVCNTATGSSATACASPLATLSASAPFLLHSRGKNNATGASPDEVENAGASLGGGVSGTSYPVASDIVFVSRRQSAQPGSEFDDILTWTAPASLYHRLVAAGQLP
ncbi:MAG: type II secretion system GspH family protein [Gammaproteobacteria bacterium]|nr:type II secretion system GspH family protein [Gammaproteobacteria bacterium]MDH4313293.1 type II secretion system GspH family protein [Gammaproteobacteria bacterium]MDH5212906.1 type II secretion system GspH family protein [Gammaproteobacteria bacterium]MDH5502116.1 type II secretion system GspH family protein [Gammaproteobacteria bacterium]